MDDENKPVKVKHKEIHVNGKTFGWVEIEINPMVFVGLIILFRARDKEESYHPKKEKPNRLTNVNGQSPAVS